MILKYIIVSLKYKHRVILQFGAIPEFNKYIIFQLFQLEKKNFELSKLENISKETELAKMEVKTEKLRYETHHNHFDN